MPGSGNLDIRDWCLRQLKKRPMQGTTPLQIADRLRGHALEAERLVEQLRPHAARSEELAATRRRERPVVLQQTALGQATPHRALIQLDTMRWLDRISYHTSRICHYLHADRSAVSA